MRVPQGATSRIIEIRVMNYESPDAAEGKPLQSLTKDTSDLVVAYRRDTAASDVQITPLETMTGGTWTERGFVHVGDGVYQIGVPNAAFAAGANTVRVIVRSASDSEEVSGLVAAHRMIELYDPRIDTAARILYRGTVGAGSTASTIADSSLPGLDDDHWQGRTVVFPEAAAAGLRFQAREILSSTSGELTMRPFTRTPTEGDPFEIV